MTQLPGCLAIKSNRLWHLSTRTLILETNTLPFTHCSPSDIAGTSKTVFTLPKQPRSGDCPVNIAADRGLTFEAHRTFAFQKMVIYDLRMDISVTEFKAHCLDLIRQVEDSGKAITIRRRGRVVARLEPASSGSGQGKPWEELRALGGHTQVKANESAWADEDFEALR